MYSAQRYKKHAPRKCTADLKQHHFTPERVIWQNASLSCQSNTQPPALRGRSARLESVLCQAQSERLLANASPPIRYTPILVSGIQICRGCPGVWPRYAAIREKVIN